VQALPGNPWEGQKGISLSGAVVIDDAATDIPQYALCFKCHGDTFATMIPPAPTRPPSGSNKRLEFQPTNDSYHPVPGPGRNQSPFLDNVLDAPDGQLRGNDWQGNRLNRFSTVLCTDCHNNDQTADTSGSARNSPSGPKGPHGSTNQRLLRANYAAVTGSVAGAPFGSFDPNNFALCFLCHDYQRLLGITASRSNFFQSGSVGAGKGNLHYLHLVDKTNAACHECHNNVHSNVQAANTDYRSSLGTDTHLVNFAPNVKPFPGNDPYYGDRPTLPRYGRTPTVPSRPYCFLSCHGKDAMDGVKTVYQPLSP
jgi:Doubled CXXCH motif (Paired_CXXCH_1)